MRWFMCSDTSLRHKQSVASDPEVWTKINEEKNVASNPATVPSFVSISHLPHRKERKCCQQLRRHCWSRFFHSPTGHRPTIKVQDGGSPLQLVSWGPSFRLLRPFPRTRGISSPPSFVPSSISRSFPLWSVLDAWFCHSHGWMVLDRMP